jgi:hypothetical protein
VKSEKKKDVGAEQGPRLGMGLPVFGGKEKASARGLRLLTFGAAYLQPAL